jgi:hypothetical protein
MVGIPTGDRYRDMRARFNDIIPAGPTNDEWMRKNMNPGNSAHAWHHWEDFLISVMAVRERTLAPEVKMV